MALAFQTEGVPRTVPEVRILDNPRGKSTDRFHPLCCMLRGSAVIVATTVAAVCLGGCATRAADPVPPETVTVPEDETTANGDDPAAGDDERITIDPDVVSFDEYHDPLMPLNRFVFGFNDIVSRYALIPLGKAYARAVPETVDRHVDNFFRNAASPVYAVNHLLQAEPKETGVNLARFGINTTIGLLGLFDPAQAWFGLERTPTDFAATLAHYEVGYGTYLVLPFFGPSDLRNAAARGVDYFFHPIPYALDDREAFIVLGYGYFEEFAQNAENLEKLMRESEDPYIFMRNLHLQSIQRDAAYRE